MGKDLGGKRGGMYAEGVKSS